ncbi:Eisosome component PIL1/LSP1, partial [Trichophaea hybrida]
SRSLSVRSRTRDNSSAVPAPPKKHRFTLASLRGNYQPELSRRLFRLIKSENYVINSYEAAGHERQSIATQLSEWGEQTGDDAVNELSDKLGVLLSEIGTQEEVFAQSLEDYRGVLKQIRNCESSVQPSRDHKAKIHDEINKLRYKDPTSSRISTLEQELVRAEAENLVAEAQLTNVTRSKLKEAFAAQFIAVIERADKQTVLARNGLRMLNLLDDTPVVPGETLPPFEHEREARQILLDAEEELKDWSLNIQ